MQELIEKLRAAKDMKGSWSLSNEALSSLGYTRRLGQWRFGQAILGSSSDVLYSIDAMNSIFDQVLPGCGRITSKGRVALGEPMYGCRIYSTDLSPVEIEAIGEGEHDLEAYAYLIAMLKAVEAKRGGAA